MAKRDAFVEDFNKLLEKIPDDYSLAQWQFAYRQVIFSMGLEILENFPNDVVGPDPSEQSSAAPQRMAMSTMDQSTPSGSGGPGGHPSTICEFACVVLGIGQPGNPPS